MREKTKIRFTVRTAISVLLLLVFGLSACGRGNRTNENEINSQQNVGEHERISHGLEEKTLSVSAPFRSLAQLQEAADAFHQTMAGRGVNVSFNFVDYIPEDRQEHNSLLLSQFAAGVGPDIFVLDNSLLYQFIKNDFLADFYTLIDESENFNRGDFFANVLEGLEINGRLYMLPLNFGIDYIGINANVPPYFINRFNSLDRAAPTDFTTLYLDLINEHPEWESFALIHGLTALQAFTPELNRAVDFMGRGVNLSNIGSLLDYIVILLT